MNFIRNLFNPGPTPITETTDESNPLDDPLYDENYVNHPLQEEKKKKELKKIYKIREIIEFNGINENNYNLFTNFLYNFYKDNINNIDRSWFYYNNNREPPYKFSEITTNDGDTLLHSCAMVGYTRLIKFILNEVLKNTNNINFLNSDGYSPLYSAFLCDIEDECDEDDVAKTIELLLQKDISLFNDDIKDNSISVYDGKYCELVKEFCFRK